MKKHNLIRFAQSLVILPVMSMPSLMGGIYHSEITKNVLVQKQNIEAPALLDLEAAETRIKADAIDAYFKARNMPLTGTGLTMVLEAEKNDIDWRLLPAIAVRESTGGKNACNKVKNNSFGWGSCKIGFESNAQAIETVARNLGGNNPKTAHHYDEKSTKQILRTYNPPSVVARYAEQVMAIMKAIGPEEVEVTLAVKA